METKKIIYGCLAGGLAFFFLGWLMYGMLLKDFFESQMGSFTGINKEEPDFPYLIIANLSWGLLITLIFGRWAKITSFGAGLQGGLLIGILSGIGFDFVMYSTTNLMTMTGALGDVAVWTIMCGVSGAIIGMVLGMGNKAAS